MMRFTWRHGVLAAVAFAGIVGALLVPRIPQDPAYHSFADTRTIAGIPNFWNVISNVPFIFVGLYGLVRVREVTPGFLRIAYITFCIGVIAVAFGSGSYHYAPSTPALVWDRLPMSIAFMSLFSAVLSERVSLPLGRALFVPLLILGVGSTFYWAWTEQHGVGDLRPYGVIQYLPMLLMPLMLLLLPGNPATARGLWWTFAFYVAAKVCEQLDAPILTATAMSGHALKHALSAVAVLFALLALLSIRPGFQSKTFVT